MSNKKLNLPTTVAALKDVLRSGIEYYQGNPVKNENKLNEAVAVALNHKNYDTLSALISSIEVIPVSKHSVLIDDDNNCFIDGQLIDPNLFEQCLVSYDIREKDEVIEFILDNISSQSPYNRDLMTQDLRLLMGEAFSQDEYVLTSNRTNDYVSKHYQSERFDLICKEIIEKNIPFNSVPCCGSCDARLDEDNSVTREYFDKDSDETVELEGSYKGVDHYFESEEGLPSGRFDCSDNSDTCTNCGHAV